jgi:tetratricopeptide (TPR) repeat protein
MSNKSIYTAIVMAVLMLSCNTKSTQITKIEDYNKYLVESDSDLLEQTIEDNNFWEEKLKKQNNQFPYNAKIAAAQSQLFQLTGTIEHLTEAENHLKVANAKTNYNNASYLRSLARNYISQHRFKEALELLENAEENGERLESTQKMLFDVYLELGDVKNAKAYLNSFIDYNNFDYLIRLAKWKDHEGDLTAAITYMEKAMELAEYSKNRFLRQWAYTNIADFYGHDGDIKKSYTYFLKALELNPQDAYAKKGIAWIVYSYERNPAESLRILNTITDYYNAPDYYLLKAEIAGFMHDDSAKSGNLKEYALAVKNKNYGAMYNKYNVLLLAEKVEDLEDAYQIALEEIENRPTAQSYDLLAWTLYKKGECQEALTIAEAHVVDKTYEPEAMFHLAKIYKVNGLNKKAKELQKELLESAYELGPLMEQEIKQL